MSIVASPSPSTFNRTLSLIALLALSLAVAFAPTFQKRSNAAVALQSSLNQSATQLIMSAARVTRSVKQSVLARETPEGVGATVRRSIGT